MHWHEYLPLYLLLILMASLSSTAYGQCVLHGGAIPVHGDHAHVHHHSSSAYAGTVMRVARTHVLPAHTALVFQSASSIGQC